MAVLNKGDKFTLDGVEYTVNSPYSAPGLDDFYHVESKYGKFTARVFRGEAPEGLTIPDSPFIMRPAEYGAVSEGILGQVFSDDWDGGDFITVAEYVEPPSTRRSADGDIARINIRGSQTRINTCLNIAEAFRALQDGSVFLGSFSAASLLINLKDGSVLLDLVGALSAGRRASYSYVKPAVLAGGAPDAASNCFTLASVVYRLFTGCNPYEGREVVSNDRLGDDYLEEVYAANPKYVYDPAHPENAPSEGVHGELISAWKILPARLKDAFARTFIPGSADAPDLDGWFRELVYLDTAMILCCKKAYYLDGPDTFVCPKCGNEYPVLTVGEYRAPITLDLSLPLMVIDPASKDYRTPAAQIKENPNAKSKGARFGLNNLTDKTWKFSFDGGEEYEVLPGKSVKPIAKGLRIDFGTGNEGTL